jgi:hypothetical protein
MKVSSVQLIDFPKIPDDRGNLTFIQEGSHIPFDIQRVYWIYDVPGGEVRGGHAYSNLYEVIIAMSGSFDVVVNDGHDEKVFSLNRSYYGLLVPKMIWRRLENFSTNSLALIVANLPYDQGDYIRDFKEYSKMNNEE